MFFRKLRLGFRKWFIFFIARLLRKRLRRAKTYDKDLIDALDEWLVKGRK